MKIRAERANDFFRSERSEGTLIFSNMILLVGKASSRGLVVKSEDL
jgi:hypothetical protein